MKIQLLEDDDLDGEAADHFTEFISQDEVNIEISKSQLNEFLKESEISQLVRAGFLTFEVTGKFQQCYLSDGHQLEKFKRLILV